MVLGKKTAIRILKSGGDVRMRGDDMARERRYDMINAKLRHSLKDEIKDLIARDYSMISGEKIRDMFADDIVKLLDERIAYAKGMDVGQVMYMAVDVNDTPGYSKNARNVRLKAVKLTLLCSSDIELMASGLSLREVREHRIVRLFKEAYEQGGLLSNNDVALLLGISPSTVSKHLNEYMERTGEIVPTRGTVHDLGRAVTHKRIIAKLYLNGMLTPEIARKTGHSEEACDRYIRDLNNIRMLLAKGLSPNEIARTLQKSSFLVKEYIKIINEYEQGVL
jgi:DNA-binding CsgD family transcriptional regulator